jgi:N-acetylglucosaminyldiphosphoundecaprenol N-acetyl-beta-D-mannosaminyltransferase
MKSDFQMYEKLKVISLGIHHVSYSDTLDRVMEWGAKNTPSYVCFANAHSTVEAHKDKLFFDALNQASLVVPDGKSVAVAAWMLHGKKQERIAGMDFMPSLLERANENRSSIFLYGSTPEILGRLEGKIKMAYPDIQIAGIISPPFGPVSEEELCEHINQINQSGAQFALISLGCPKQEKWMAANSSKINGVLLGVGGAFPVVAGLQRRSPIWMQKFGLEWMHRLILEPRRMFKRYFYNNFYFLYLLFKAMITKKA